jgi:hypothetical protein
VLDAALLQKVFGLATEVRSSDAGGYVDFAP